MQDEAIEKLITTTKGIYVDATLGRGGHTLAILKKLASDGRLIALDQDADAIEYAQTNLQDKRLSVHHINFSGLKGLLKEHHLLGKVNGILVDLGVSSPQLDNAHRGFSFQHNGVLDMRMNQTVGLSVSQWLAQANEKEIADVLYQYGEERKSRLIAKEIKKQQRPITTTFELVDVITRVIPFNKHKHPATRTFQALRIFINQELNALQTLLNDVYDILAVGGRFVAISFHSLEDRMVKRFIQQNSRLNTPPKGVPMMEKDISAAKFTNLGKFKASVQEIGQNKRARSAMMRVCQKAI